MSIQHDADRTSPHIPVLLQPVIEFAHLKAGNTVIDGTIGFGGHAEAMMKIVSHSGKLLGIDKDERAVEASRERLAAYGSAVRIVEGRISDLAEIAESHGVQNADCVLFDLGVSSPQLDDASYGISFTSSGRLDMRIGTGSGKTSAADIINRWSAKELKELFTEHGQPATNRLVARIVDERERAPIHRIEQLLQIIHESVPRVKGTNPATGVFQALRVVVNDEMGEMKRGLEQAVGLLKKGGRLLVISFHSGEDRIVKEFMREAAKDCICPPEFPECRCDHRAEVRIITAKPIVASDMEHRHNPRSRSARLRVAERI